MGGYNGLGPGQSFKRTYTILGATQNSLEITFTMYACDNWSPADSLQIKVGTVTTTLSGLIVNNFQSNLCGGTEKDQKMTIYFQTSHSGASLPIEFIS